MTFKTFTQWLESFQPGQKVLAWGPTGEGYDNLNWIPATVTDANQWEVRVKTDDGREWVLMHGQVKAAPSAI